MNPSFQPLNRRRFMRVSASLGLLAGLRGLMPAYAVEPTGLKATNANDADASKLDLVIREHRLSLLLYHRHHRHR